MSFSLRSYRGFRVQGLLRTTLVHVSNDRLRPKAEVHDRPLPEGDLMPISIRTPD